MALHSAPDHSPVANRPNSTVPSALTADPAINIFRASMRSVSVANTGTASMKVRTGSAQWLAEAVAAFGLVATILAGVRFSRPAVPWLVGLYITAAYWFTASTSFANPAVAIARSLTNTFSGIRPVDLPGFIVSELVGAVLALMLMSWLLRAAGAAAVATKEITP